MRISDWSSDVCSSDLRLGVDRFQFRNVRRVGVSSIEGIKHADKFFIGGEWVSPSTSSKIDVINPATEEVIPTAAEADRKSTPQNPSHLCHDRLPYSAGKNNTDTPRAQQRHDANIT